MINVKQTTKYRNLKDLERKIWNAICYFKETILQKEKKEKTETRTSLPIETGHKQDRRGQSIYKEG
jgi:hypothetical protein